MRSDLTHFWWISRCQTDAVLHVFSAGAPSVLVQPGRAVQLRGDRHRAPHSGHPGQPPPHRLPQRHLQRLSQLQVPQMVRRQMREFQTDDISVVWLCILVFLCLALMLSGPWTRECLPLLTSSCTTISGLFCCLPNTWKSFDYITRSKSLRVSIITFNFILNVSHKVRTELFFLLQVGAVHESHWTSQRFPGPVPAAKADRDRDQ